MTLPSRLSDLIPFDLLLSVARLGSLGRAAAEHGMSQPAAVDAATALDTGVTALRREQESRLRVAASLTVAEYLLPAWLTVAPGHPWTRRRSGIAAAELAATPLVTREAASGTRRFFEQALHDQPPPTQARQNHQVPQDHVQLTPVPPLAELSSTTAIKSAVAAGAGPAVLSSLAVAGELTAGTLRAVPVSGLDLRRDLRAAWPTGRRLTGPAQDLYLIAARSGRPG